jgi:transcriptional regulator with XRE-family HTH domain
MEDTCAGLNEKQKFGARLTTAREAAGMTLEEVGAHFGISAQAVQQWEKGKSDPSVTRDRLVAKLLNRNVAWLVTGHGDIPSPSDSNLRLAAHAAYWALLVASEKMPDLKPTVRLLADALGLSKPQVAADE